MFWQKKAAPVEAEEQPKKPVSRHPVRSFFRFLGKTVKYVFILVLLIISVAIAGLFWITQTESGQAWVVKTANSALAVPEGADGLGINITSLAGSIPADFRFGITVTDKHGVWLTAPENRLVWNWRELPQTVHFPIIEAANIDATRLPDLPPSPPSPPTEDKPFTIKDLQNLLNQAAAFMAQKHWWLPAIKFDQIAVSNALLPESILPGPENKPQRLEANARLALAVVDNAATGELNADVKNQLGAKLALPSASIENLAATVKLSLAPQDNGIASNVSLETTIGKPLLGIKEIPADFLGEQPKLSLALQAEANTGEKEPGVKIGIAGPGLDAGHMTMTGSGQWQTDQSWQECEIAGPLTYELSFALQPLAQGIDSPLAAIRQPASLNLDIDGYLPKLNLNLGLACADIAQSGHQIQDAHLNLSAKEVELPLNATDLNALEKENHLNVNLAALVDSHKVTTNTEVFFQTLQANDPGNAKGWRVGLRDLIINALGLHGTGNLAVLLPDGQKPGLDGKINLFVKDWTDINKFIPGQTLSGNVQLVAQLASGLRPDLANPDSRPAAIVLPQAAKLSQAADISLKIPGLAMRSASSTMELANLDSRTKLTDIFNALALDTRLTASKIAAAGMQLSADIQANGPLSGPIKADVTTKGSVNSRIAAQWEPGKAQIGTLEVVTDVSAFMNKKAGKKMLAGLRSTQAAQITYGDNGFHVNNLNLNLLPGGRLQANGGLAPDKLDFKLNLSNLQLKPWQALIAAIPTGQIDLSANISGSPKRPSGNFNLSVKDLTVSKSPLPPLSLGLAGVLEHGSKTSTLKTRLELDPKTVKALGGNTALVTANLPLVFGPDGIPKPNMPGPLEARVHWDGALGPLWNLLPMADQRLNGRVNIDMDASGSLDKPKIKGNAAITKARYENVLFGVLLTDINLKVGLTDAVSVKSKGGLPGGMTLALNMSDGRGGTVTANGKGAINGDNLDIKAKINKLKPLRRRDVHIELSGHVDVSGNATDPKVDGEIVVDKGEVLLNNLEIASTSVTTLNISTPEEAAKALKEAEKAAQKTVKSAVRKVAKTDRKTGKNTKKEAISQGSTAPVAPLPATGAGGLNLRFTMLPRFSVEGRGLASLWKANLLIQGPLTNPHVSGNISSVRGNFDFLGKNFALTRGVVFFGGGSLSNPLVDIDLTNETPDLTAHILVTGPVNKIKLKLTSDPSVPRDEILSRVLFGRSVNDLSRMEALQLAGAVAQLAGFGGGSGPLGLAKKALGVDVLRIGTSDTGATGDNNAGGTNIEMGKYINDFIYMGVQQGLKPDSTAFIIEIELTPHSNIELRTEQDNTWAGYKWKYNY